MKFKKEMFVEFPSLLAKYSKQMACHASFPQFDLMRELMQPKYETGNSCSTLAPQYPTKSDSQLSASDLNDIERIAAILAAAANMHELLINNKNNIAGGHHFGGSNDSHNYNNYRGFIASLTRTFFEKYQIEEIQKGRDVYAAQESGMSDFALHLLERPLASFFEDMLFEELIDEEKMAMSYDEWNGFVKFIVEVRTFLSHVYIPADTKTFYGVGFNSRFGSLVSFRNEKRRRLRQQDMSKEIEELKAINAEQTKQIAQLQTSITTLAERFDSDITGLMNSVGVSLDTILTAVTTKKSKKTTQS